MRVLVTGATGHLGTYVTDALLRAGYAVCAVSRSGARPAPPFGSTPCADAVPLTAAAVDLTTEASVVQLADLIADGDAVVHLAAWHPPATATTGAADRERLLQTNVYGTMRLLDAARARVACVVYASSFEVYGRSDADTIDESHRTYPLTDYGATKLSGEHHLAAFAYEEKVRGVILRMPAIYGPGEITSRALPNFLRAVAAGRRPVIHGDGADLRDQLHAADAAAAVRVALRSEASGVFNVADGERHSVREVAETAMRIAGQPGEPERRPRTKARLDFHMAIDRARRQLEFTPAVSLSDGMAAQLAWLRASG